MAPRFWVGGTGTWDAADTTHWAATTGGAGGQSVPGTGDTVTFDGSSGGGTVTVNANHSISSLITGAFTGTIDFSANNNSINIGTVTATALGWSDNGTGAHTINMGNGTWTLDSTSTYLNVPLAGSLTLNANSSLVTVIGHQGPRTLQWGKTLNNVTLPGGAGFEYTLNSAEFCNVLTIGAPCTVTFTSTITYTYTTLTLNSSSSTAAIILRSPAAGQATLAVTNAPSCSWGIFEGLNFSSGALTATNSINMGNNTGATITGPSTGGTSGVIGG
jgi:hypothetical protein